MRFWLVYQLPTRAQQRLPQWRGPCHFLCWLRGPYTVVKESWGRPKKSRILKPANIYSVAHRNLRQIVKQRRAKVGSSNLSNTHLDSTQIQLNHAESQHTIKFPVRYLLKKGAFCYKWVTLPHTCHLLNYYAFPKYLKPCFRIVYL